MLFNFFIETIISAINFLSSVFPNYSEYPLPEDLLNNINYIFGYIKVVAELPFLRVLVELFNWYLPIFIVFAVIQFVLNFVGYIRGSNKLEI